MPTQIASSARGIGRSPATSSVIALSQLAATRTTTAKDERTEREHATCERARTTVARRAATGRSIRCDLRRDVDVRTEPDDAFFDELERLVDDGRFADLRRDDVERERAGLARADERVDGGGAVRR